MFLTQLMYCIFPMFTYLLRVICIVNCSLVYIFVPSFVKFDID